MTGGNRPSGEQRPKTQGCQQSASEERRALHHRTPESLRHWRQQVPAGTVCFPHKGLMLPCHQVLVWTNFHIRSTACSVLSTLNTLVGFVQLFRGDGLNSNLHAITNPTCLRCKTSEGLCLWDCPPAFSHLWIRKCETSSSFLHRILTQAWGTASWQRKVLISELTENCLCFGASAKSHLSTGESNPVNSGPFPCHF